jgi:hypothetical protein
MTEGELTPSVSCIEIVMIVNLCDFFERLALPAGSYSRNEKKEILFYNIFVMHA